MPSRLAANFDAFSIPCSSAFTPSDAADEPVKNVLIPSAASTPLVSPANENSSRSIRPKAAAHRSPRCWPSESVDRVELRRPGSRASCPRPARSRSTTQRVRVRDLRVRLAAHDHVERAADRRERQTRLIERRVRVVDRLHARELLEPDQPLALRIHLVELERQRAGQLIEPREKAADDFVARRVQALQLAGRRVQLPNPCRRI